jgi:hypothetical protein
MGVCMHNGLTLESCSTKMKIDIRNGEDNNIDEIGILCLTVDWRCDSMAWDGKHKRRVYKVLSKHRGEATGWHMTRTTVCQTWRVNIQGKSSCPILCTLSRHYQTLDTNQARAKQDNPQPTPTFKRPTRIFVE